MPTLRSCYFCGAVSDSLQEFELLPERLVSAEQPPSAVLCSTCREKLRRVLEPLPGESTDQPAVSTSGSTLQEVTFDSSSDADEPSDADDLPGTDPDEVTDRDGDASDGRSGADTDDDSAVDELPDGYHKVIRLLQNREFPMERDDLTALVTGAYDISASRCERILETAVERGVLVEDGSTIDRPRE